MKINHPIKIDFKDFILEGKFDYIRPGQTKEWILQNFPAPDYYDGSSERFKDNIWLYGNIEFHFHEGELVWIFSDYLDTLDGGPHLELDKWILEAPSDLSLSKVIAILNDQGADYRVKPYPKLFQVRLIVRSGMELSFYSRKEWEKHYEGELPEELKESPNQYLMGSFTWKGKPAN